MPQVWSVSADGGWPTPVTALDDPVNSVEWSPSGDWLAISVAPGGGMNSQIYLVHPDGTAHPKLVHYSASDASSSATALLKGTVTTFLFNSETKTVELCSK
jgi:Tol biopolymer transport system component